MFRDAQGRFLTLRHDPTHPWVLVATDVRPPEPFMKFAHHHDGRYHQRVSGGVLVRTHKDRRHH